MSNTSVEQQLAVMANDLNYIKSDLKLIKEELEGKYVTRDQFEPVRKLAYGSVAIILTTVIAGVLAIIIK